MACRVITQIYDEHLRAAGINGPQYSLLRYIDASGGATIRELGDALRLEQSTVTRNIALLEGREYISLSPCPGDRRKKIPSLTERGRDKLAESAKLWLEAQEHIRMELGGDGVKRLYEATRDVAKLV
jgi:DNA-binding MarR family transcriptional regulator